MYLTRLSIRVHTPILGCAAQQQTGVMSPPRIPLFRPEIISSRESSPSSKNFSIRASSVSAAASVRAS